MSRTETINTIIANRKPIAEKTAKTIAHLENVRGALRLCSDMLQRALPKASDEQKSVLQEHNTEIDRFVNDLIPARIRELDQLQHRFNRPTLNIGVVGNARQGKSTFLQALTGLSSEEIPAAETDHCTGAPSIVINHHETYANIEFFEEEEFLKEIILPFYTQLNLTPQPNSFYAFANTALTQPSRQLSATEQALYEKLEYRKGTAKQYQTNFGKRTERIGKEKIREYIAQQDNNGNKISTWLAVKMATIYCPFSVPDTGKISVCDTPGLGDFVCGAETNLVHNIGNNLDAVIMLKRTPKGGIATPEDTQLYDLLPEAVSELEPKDWSYFIVNRDGTDNETKSFEQQIQQKIKCRRFVTLDARQQNEVINSFDLILQDIADNQHALDKTLYSKRFAEVQKLLTEVKALMEKLAELFPKQCVGVSSADAVLAQSLFKGEIWDNLASKLFESVDKCRDEQDTPNKEFLQKLNEIETQLKTIPNLPAEDAMKKKKGTGLNAAFPVFCQDVRRGVLKHFDSLDEVLHKMFDDLRVEAKECFTAEDGGKLAAVTLTQDNTTIQDNATTQDNETENMWWDSLAEQFETLGATDRERDNALRIAEAIRQFNTATLSFRSFLLPRVLPCFNTLNADRQEHRPYTFDNNKDIPELIAQIQKAAEHGIGKAIQILRDCATEPSIALFATLDDLHDAVVHTGSADTARDLWSYFYADHRSEIWQEQFQQKEADSKFRKDWQDTLNRTNTAVRSVEIS
jgi:GTPase Era involved in 16S rRNA processing